MWRGKPILSLVSIFRHHVIFLDPEAGTHKDGVENSKPKKVLVCPSTRMIGIQILKFHCRGVTSQIISKLRIFYWISDPIHFRFFVIYEKSAHFCRKCQKQPFLVSFRLEACFFRSFILFSIETGDFCKICFQNYISHDRIIKCFCLTLQSSPQSVFPYFVLWDQGLTVDCSMDFFGALNLTYFVLGINLEGAFSFSCRYRVYQALQK